MYELKHDSPAELVRRGTFNVRALERKSIMKFARGPKLTTLATHVNLADETPIHCMLEGSLEEVNFKVPEQPFDIQYGFDGRRYIVTKVTNPEVGTATLVIREYDRRGFLVPCNEK
ncbi:MAG: hypothetical protein ACAH17_02515 [Candidatus Paceibacterota bacterium]